MSQPHVPTRLSTQKATTHVDPNAVAPQNSSRSGSQQGRRSYSRDHSYQLSVVTPRVENTLLRLQSEAESWDDRRNHIRQHEDDVRRRADALERAARDKAQLQLDIENEHLHHAIMLNAERRADKMERSTLREDHIHASVDRKQRHQRLWEDTVLKESQEKLQHASQLHNVTLGDKANTAAHKNEMRRRHHEEVQHKMKLAAERAERERRQEEVKRRHSVAEYNAMQRAEFFRRKEEERQRVMEAQQRNARLERMRLEREEQRKQEQAKRRNAALAARAQEIQQRQERKELNMQRVHASMQVTERQRGKQMDRFMQEYEENLAIGHTTRMHNALYRHSYQPYSFGGNSARRQ